MAEQLRGCAGMTPFFVLNAAAPSGATAHPGPLTAPGTRRLRVLIAEDDPTNRLVTTRMLQRMGHAVEAARTVPRRCGCCRARRCDLVLMDMLMPVMDGIAATRLIRAAPEPLGKVPIVGLTGNSEAEHERACLEAGMNGFITKPVTTRRLTAAIMAVIQANKVPPAPEAEAHAVLLDEAFLRQLGEEIGPDGALDAMEMFLEDAPERRAAMRGRWTQEPAARCTARPMRSPGQLGMLAWCGWVRRHLPCKRRWRPRPIRIPRISISYSSCWPTARRRRWNGRCGRPRIQQGERPIDTDS